MSRLVISFFFILLPFAARTQTSYESLMDLYHQEKNFHGVVLAATDGKVDFIQAKGLANRTFGISMNTDSKFKIASVTKTFTAVMILQLFQEGKINLRASLGTYLPEYMGEAKDRVTLHQLLTYSSGIPNCEGDTGIVVYQSALSVDEFILRHCSGKLEFEPGSRFSYNNGDYILLGRIIEAVTGKSFSQNLNERILHPLEMRDTDLLYHRDILPNLAETYNLDEATGIFYKDDPMYIENYFAAGAMYSTAEDLLKFSEGIFKAKLLNQEMLNLMLTPYPELYGVAYGFWVTDYTFGEQTFSVANRQGSIWGANANWLKLIDGNKTFIVLSNTNATNLPEMTEQLVMISTASLPIPSK